MRTKNGSSHATKTSLFLFRRSLLLMRVGNLGTHCWRIWWYSFYKISALLVLVVSCARIGLSAPFSWRLSSPVACRAHAEQGLVYSSNSATISHNHVIHTNKTCILFAKVSCNNIGSSLSSLSTTILSGYRLVSKADARDGII